MMDIKKQFSKVNIDVKIHKDYFIFTFPDKSEKVVKQKDLEQYLFICLLDYVEEN